MGDKKITVYGIMNCNTVKKALDFLKENGYDYDFQDFKKKGVTQITLLQWEKKVGWDALLNKRGTTWRTLTEGEKQLIMNASSALSLMRRKITVIKRPVVVFGEEIILGFNEEEYIKRLPK